MLGTSLLLLVEWRSLVPFGLFLMVSENHRPSLSISLGRGEGNNCVFLSNGE